MPTISIKKELFAGSKLTTVEEWKAILSELSPGSIEDWRELKSALDKDYEYVTNQYEPGLSDNWKLTFRMIGDQFIEKNSDTELNRKKRKSCNERADELNRRLNETIYNFGANGYCSADYAYDYRLLDWATFLLSLQIRKKGDIFPHAWNLVFFKYSMRENANRSHMPWIIEGVWSYDSWKGKSELLWNDIYRE